MWQLNNAWRENNFCRCQVPGRIGGISWRSYWIRIVDTLAAQSPAKQGKTVTGKTIPLIHQISSKCPLRVKKFAPQPAQSLCNTENCMAKSKWDKMEFYHPAQF